MLCTLLTIVASPTIAKSLSVSKRTSILLISIILFYSSIAAFLIKSF